MSVNLTKGVGVDLSKEANRQLGRLAFGLGWSPVKQTSGGGVWGFVKSVFDGDDEKPAIDLDASCVLLDANGTVVDTVWFRKLRSNDNAVKHSGDNRTGSGDVDDEVITVDVDELQARVMTMVFTINSFTGQKFSAVDDAYCRVVELGYNKEIARFTLNANGLGDSNAILMMKVCRKSGTWVCTAIGTTSKGRTVQDLVPAIQACVR